MKPIRIFSLALASLLSCNRPASTTTITLVVDRTDTTMTCPRASAVITPFTQANLWQHVHIVVTSITDRDINDTQMFNLPTENEWTDNKDMRQARITHFVSQVQRTLDSVCNTTKCGHSIVYRTIATQANQLAAISASHKVLIICSDLYEHDRISFYNPLTVALLQQKPDSMQHLLEKQVPLANLSGVDTWLLYNPRTYQDNNAYMPVAHFYEHLLTAHGATVHIANSFNPL